MTFTLYGEPLACEIAPVSSYHRLFVKKYVISRFRRENCIILLDNRQQPVGRWEVLGGAGEIYAVIRQGEKRGNTYHFGKFAHGRFSSDLTLEKHPAWFEVRPGLVSTLDGNSTFRKDTKITTPVR